MSKRFSLHPFAGLLSIHHLIDAWQTSSWNINFLSNRAHDKVYDARFKITRHENMEGSLKEK